MRHTLLVAALLLATIPLVAPAAQAFPNCPGYPPPMGSGAAYLSATCAGFAVGVPNPGQACNFPFQQEVAAAGFDVFVSLGRPWCSPETVLVGLPTLP